MKLFLFLKFVHKIVATVTPPMKRKHLRKTEKQFPKKSWLPPLTAEKQLENVFIYFAFFMTPKRVIKAYLAVVKRPINSLFVILRSIYKLTYLIILMQTKTNYRPIEKV